jgi:restriction system protein
MNNPHIRVLALESVMNKLFKAYGILVKEAFTLRGDKGEGIIEQIDGVI